MLKREKNFLEELVRDDDVLLSIDYLEDTVVAIYYKRHGEYFVHFVYSTGVVSNKRVESIYEVNGMQTAYHLLGFNNFPIYDSWKGLEEDLRENLFTVYTSIYLKATETREGFKEKLAEEQETKVEAVEEAEDVKKEVEETVN